MAPAVPWARRQAMKPFVSLREPQSTAFQFRLSVAEARHRELDTRLKQLGRHAFLTPAEQREILELKKRKLQLKDEVTALQRRG
jgi:uncharacterized protein YdcH (DUF465 family)